MKKIITYLIFMFLVQISVHAQTTYVLIGWNDLGMHCSNKNFSKIAVLPPYNNIYAQLIKKVPGQAPQIITDGVTIEYSVPNNTYSVGKTDFWDYAQQLFNLPAPLPPNIGLTGKGLTGTLDTSGNYFYARGIPLTPYTDSSLTTPNPYQLVHLVAKVTGSSTILATTDAVIPVSNEIGCVQSGCHNSEQQILNNHDDDFINITGLTPPVLCANCHADNALGTPGNGEAPPFSQAIHLKHAGLGLPNTIETCYKCHPGPDTQCLRGAMVDFPPPTNPMICEDCHGTLYNVGNSVRNGREPWLEEPTCGTCHGSNYATEPGKLFKDSHGHGGLFCSACHGSPHGIWPTRIANDNLQSIILQGTAGTIIECSVCHGDDPQEGGPHGITLPVELTNFTADYVEGNINLCWSTATETNNKGFEVDRKDKSSIKNQRWENIGFVNGNGTTSGPKSYSFTDKNPAAGYYVYRLKQFDLNGSYKYSQSIEVKVNPVSGFTLEQNYPNPFNPSTKIKFEISKPGFVSLKVYDVLGKEVTTLVNEEKQQGTYEVSFDGSRLSSGIYFYKLKVGTLVSVKKMILSK